MLKCLKHVHSACNMFHWEEEADECCIINGHKKWCDRTQT